MELETVRRKMETLFHVLISAHLGLGISGGFLIVHEQKQQCIYENKNTAYVGTCNFTNVNQQWRWIQDEKLLHIRSGQCLAFTKFSPAHSRKAIIANCSEAPSWTCDGKENLLEVRNSNLFLKKQGPKAVVKMGKKYPHGWRKIDVSDRGEPVQENLCSKKDLQVGELFARSTRDSLPPFPSTTHSPRTFLSRSSTAFFIRTVPANDSKNMDKLNSKQVVFETTEEPWVSTTTPRFFATTEQSGLAAPVRCAINQTEWKVSGQSVHLKWNSLGSPCNFSVTCSPHHTLHGICHPIQKANNSFECGYDGLEGGTLYYLSILSLSSGEARNITVQTDPLPPAQFDIKKEKNTTTTFQIWWSASLGKVDKYELQLSDRNKKTLQEIQVPGGSSRNEWTYTNLIPGSQYIVSISAVAGHKKSPSVEIISSTAPSPVENIQALAKTESIHVSWLPGQGNVDKYTLFLLTKDGPVQQIDLEKHSLYHNFSGLTSGCLYNLTIITKAEELENYNFRLIRTVPSKVVNLKVVNSNSSNMLQVSWKRPPGNLDFYNVSLFHLGSLKEEKTLQPQVTETHFDKLISGRLYQVDVNTVSGELVSKETAYARTVPEKVTELKADSMGSLTSLKVIWLPPHGDWDKYYIVMFDRNTVLLNTTVEKDKREFIIKDVGLISGRQYEVEVAVESGGLRNSKRCKGRTGKQTFSHGGHPDLLILDRGMSSHCGSNTVSQSYCAFNSTYSTTSNLLLHIRTTSKNCQRYRIQGSNTEMQGKFPTLFLLCTLLFKWHTDD